LIVGTQQLIGSPGVTPATLESLSVAYALDDDPTVIAERVRETVEE
jgi:hypothetical protein